MTSFKNRCRKFQRPTCLVHASWVGGYAPHTPHLRLRPGGLRPPGPPIGASAPELNIYGTLVPSICPCAECLGAVCPCAECPFAECPCAKLLPSWTKAFTQLDQSFYPAGPKFLPSWTKAFTQLDQNFYPAGPKLLPSWTKASTQLDQSDTHGP